jgi:hypothetical protein
VAAALLFAACGGAKQTDTKSPASVSLPPPEQAFAIETLRSREYLGNVQETVMDATRATMNLDTKDLKVFDVTVAFTTGLTTGTQGQGTVTTGTLTSERGTLYTDDKPDEGISKNDILLEGDVRLCENAMKVRAPSVRYYAPKVPAETTGEDIAFRSGGGEFESDMATPTGGTMHSTGTYFEANRAHTVIRGYGPGTMQSGSGVTSATALSAQEKPEVTAPKYPATSGAPAKPRPAPTAAAAKTSKKTPVKKPAQSK